jgi:hypothetical protein
MKDKGCLHVVRGTECKLTLPSSGVLIKDDGSLWYSGTPLLGCAEPQDRDLCKELVKSKKFDSIPAKFFVKLGENENGVWAGWTSEYEKHPAKLLKDKKEAEEKKIKENSVSIHLSTRGWGDYSSVVWYGDITKPFSEIVAECQKLLKTGHDVDHKVQSDEEVLQKIKIAHEKWLGEQAPKPESSHTETHGAGYCYSCESYCYGDCGDYHPTLTTDLIAKRFQKMSREDEFGTAD